MASDLANLQFYFLPELKEILIVLPAHFEGTVLPISEVSNYLMFKKLPSLEIRMELHKPGLFNGEYKPISNAKMQLSTKITSGCCFIELGQLSSFAEVVQITNGQDWW